MRINVHNQGTHPDGLVERTSSVFQVNLRNAAESGMGDRREADAPWIPSHHQDECRNRQRMLSRLRSRKISAPRV